MLPRNIVTVDVEDYFQVEAFADLISRDSWGQYNCRVEEHTRRLLDLFDVCGVKGTFFTLGWIADRFPKLVMDIVSRGHELACHSFWHRMITQLSPREFRDDTRRAKDCLEQIAGVVITGYRAPTFSITRKTWWAFEILAELGFSYDSSVFPISHDRYGVPDAPRVSFQVNTPGGAVTEYPLTTFRLGIGPNLPVGGGGYLRLLPEFYTKWGVSRAAAAGVPTIVYIHPWEIDPDQPHIAAGWKTELRHYANLSRMMSRLQTLLSLGSFTNFREYQAQLSTESNAATSAALPMPAMPVLRARAAHMSSAD